MEDFSLSTVVSRQTPAFEIIGETMSCLAACMQYSASRDTAGILLQKPAVRNQHGHIVALGETSDLGSELDLLSHRGFRTYTAATRELYNIKVISMGLAHPNGSLDTLKQNFGKPKTASNNQRMLARIVEDAQRYSKSIAELQDMFVKFEDEVMAFRVALRSLARTTAKTVDNLSQQSRELEQESDAKALKYELAARHFNDAESQMARLRIADRPDGSYIHWPQSTSAIEYVLTAASMVKASWSWLKTAGASQSRRDAAAAAERDMVRKKIDVDKCRTAIADAKAQLSVLQGKKKPEDDVALLIERTLSAVLIIGGQTGAFVTEIQEMVSNINEFATVWAPNLERIAFSDDAAQANSIESLRRDCLIMEQYALTTGHMAWLYADTIRDIMVKGFAIMRTAGRSADMSGKEFRQSSSSLVLAAGAIQSDFAMIEHKIAAPIDQSYRDNYGRLQSTTSLPRLREIVSAPGPQPQPPSKPGQGIRKLFKRKSGSVYLP